MSRELLSCFVVVATGCGSPVTDEDGGRRDGGPDGRVNLCARDSDCGESTFCSRPRCMVGEPGADARGCVDLGPPCPAGQTCDESNGVCGAPTWCTEGRDGCLAPGNCDGDGELALECGGGDCDDDDGARYHDNFEACDASHDEDCDPTSFGDLDADDDGFVSNACCNGDACGDDCDDSRREVFPGATEACNAVDDDCNGFVDDPGAFCPVGTCTDRRCRSLSWEWTYGALAAERVGGVAADGSGNIYVLLRLTGPMDVDGDGTEEAAGTTLVSLTAEGRHRWVSHLSDLYAAHERLELSPYGDSVLTADRSGSLQWYSLADGSHRRGIEIDPPAGASSMAIVDFAWASDHVFVAADVEQASDRGILVVKLDAAGIEVARRYIDASGTDQRVAALDVNSRGDVVIAGESLGEIDLGSGDPIDGGFLAQLDPALELRWATSLPVRVGNFALQPPDVAVADDGEVAAVGTYSGAPTAWGEAWPDLCPTGCRSMFVVSLSPDGSHRWSRQYAGRWTLTDPSNSSVGFDERGGITVAGTFDGMLDVRPHGLWTAGASEGGCDAFLATWDASDASVVYARRITGPSCPENIAFTAIDPFGAIILGGTFRQSVTLLRGTYASQGDTDAFVVRASD